MANIDTPDFEESASQASVKIQLFEILSIHMTLDCHCGFSSHPKRILQYNYNTFQL